MDAADPRTPIDRLTLWLCITGVALGACGVDRMADMSAPPPVPGDADPGPEHPAYVEHIAPILERACLGCHGATSAVTETRNCVRTDHWDSDPDPDQRCSDAATGGMIFGVRDAGPMIAANVASRRMPLSGPPLSEAELAVFQRWADAGYPKRATNQPPVIQLIDPPAAGATVCMDNCNYPISYVASDPDGDSVRWSLGWSGAGTTGVFASKLAGGSGTVTIDASVLAGGSYTLTATLDDGTATVSAAAAGTLTVPPAHDAAPVVTVASPNGGESYADDQPIQIAWIGSDPDDATLTYDVRAIGATTIEIAMVTLPAGPAQLAWTPPRVTAPAAFRIEIAVRDGAARAAPIADRSDADFAITPPAVPVSFAQQIQPILTASCTTGACHAGNSPAAGLSLVAGRAYAALVNVAANESPCTSYALVEPGQPDQSFVVFKLQGTGACASGSRMPRGMAALPAAQLQLIRD